jgi:3-methyladenine DNA glycosylase AlkD
MIDGSGLSTWKKIKTELEGLFDNDRAKNSEWFFKTGKGEYGEGDRFLGIDVPSQRNVARRYFELADLDDVEKLLGDGFHEVRLTAVIMLVEKFLKAGEKDKEKIFRFYLAHTDRMNNWDIVDVSAPKIIGRWLLGRDKKIIYKLARSKNIWERRMAIVSTLTSVSEGELNDAFSIAEILLGDEEDLIRKAVGWILRECGKKDMKRLKKFIADNGKSMSRVTLRYSLEKFPESERKYILKETKK